MLPYPSVVLFFPGCFFRVLENSNTVCIFCDSAAVELENLTVCTYSKNWELPTVLTLLCSERRFLHCVMFLRFCFVLIPFSVCRLDYTLERKNHTTVTTVIPKIGKK